MSFDIAPTEPEGADTLPYLAHEVRQLYQELLLHPDNETRSNQDSQNLVDHFGRLRIWMEQTGAALENQDSLSNSLRNEPSLRTSVADVLGQLKMLLSAAKSTHPSSSRPALLAPESYHDAESSFTSDSEYSAESQQTGSAHDATRTRPRISRFSLVLSHIFEQIGLLYHYSAIFRRPRLQGRYLHSKSETPDPAIPHYEYSHVQQRFREWSSRVSVPSREPGEELKASPVSQHSRPEFSFEEDVLCLRFAAANTRRREQLRYWAKRPFAEGHDQGIEPSLSRGTAASAPSEGPSRRSNTTTVNTFSSVARSDIYEAEMQVGQSRTTYADSTMSDMESSTSARVPGIPSVASSSPTFECPFCRMTLDSAPMQTRNTWKRHVFRDLRPYTCTFLQCSNPDKLYATRREWIYHEMQMHRRQWKCRPCKDSFKTKEAMASHLRSSHPEWEERQLPAVLEVSEAPLDGSQQSCPLCQLPFSLSVLLRHVAGHMEQLALFVLPSGDHGPPQEPSSAALSSLDTIDDDDDIWMGDDNVDRPGEYDNLGTSLPTSPQRQRITDHGSENEWPPTSPQLLPDRIQLDKVFACDQCGRMFDQVHKLK